MSGVQTWERVVLDDRAESSKGRPEICMQRGARSECAASPEWLEAGGMTFGIFRLTYLEVSDGLCVVGHDAGLCCSQETIDRSWQTTSGPPAIQRPADSCLGLLSIGAKNPRLHPIDLRSWPC